MIILATNINTAKYEEYTIINSHVIYWVSVKLCHKYVWLRLLLCTVRLCFNGGVLNYYVFEVVCKGGQQAVVNVTFVYGEAYIINLNKYDLFDGTTQTKQQIK